MVNANYEETLYKVKFWIRVTERFLHYQQHIFRNIVEVDLFVRKYRAVILRMTLFLSLAMDSWISISFALALVAASFLALSTTPSQESR